MVNGLLVEFLIVGQHKVKAIGQIIQVAL